MMMMMMTRMMMRIRITLPPTPTPTPIPITGLVVVKIGEAKGEVRIQISARVNMCFGQSGCILHMQLLYLAKSKSAVSSQFCLLTRKNYSQAP